MRVIVKSAELCQICNQRLLNKTPLALVKKCNHLFHNSCLNQAPTNCPKCKKTITKIDRELQIIEDKPVFEDPKKMKRLVYVGAVALSIVAFGVLSSTGTILVANSAFGLSAYLMGRSVDWYFRV